MRVIMSYDKYKQIQDSKFEILKKWKSPRGYNLPKLTQQEIKKIYNH